ncbi:uncharacterized protein TrAtP1_000228 [Trichoderma atroviride]|uniref:Uncharacterized protein n=1 Tax=Hypocrea atroviridis (strain ATCC 20476 / IMI 206040) TaxID=452589 RepID=G9NJU8_HYPAI|nr:uncharacterized protein TRIATDRAFT_305019 [Trichoderma atroviride IMI 206040]EHK49170.1 hypothetical protein TRIATDRAFT_305019 [Trichoderma atroviride IMI 206040]UKZ58907.1 hypothetical protein TrAtP1_000228 [Trichoderma atroviride]
MATLGTKGGPPNFVHGSKDLVFSTHLTFNEPVSSITNGQLAQMVEDARKEALVDLEQYDFNEKRLPSVITIFAFGNEVILSTSQKGPSFAYDFVVSPVQQSLAICTAVWKDQTGEEKIHFRKGSCGEIMCAHQYYQGHTTPLKEANVRALSGFIYRRQKKVDFIPPCGSNQKDDWGCDLFISQNNINFLNIKTEQEAYDLKTLAGGIKKIDQIRTC